MKDIVDNPINNSKPSFTEHSESPKSNFNSLCTNQSKTHHNLGHLLDVVSDDEFCVNSNIISPEHDVDITTNGNDKIENGDPIKTQHNLGHLLDVVSDDEFGVNSNNNSPEHEIDITTNEMNRNDKIDNDKISMLLSRDSKIPTQLSSIQSDDSHCYSDAIDNVNPRVKEADISCLEVFEFEEFY